MDIKGKVMKIYSLTVNTGIRNNNITNNINLKPKLNIGLKQPLKKDTVSFSGKNYLIGAVNDNVKQAVSLGEQLIEQGKNQNLTIDSIQDIISQNSDDLKVKPVSELKQVMPESNIYNAYYSYDIKPDFTIFDRILYTRVEDTNIEGLDLIETVMNTTHEYTHYRQTKKEADLLNDLSNENYNQAKLISYIGQSMFLSIFDSEMQKEVLLPSLKKSNVIQKFMMPKSNENSNFVIVPKEQKVTPQTVLKAAGFKNVNEFRKYVNSNFNKGYNVIAKYFAENHPLADDFPDKNNPRSLYKQVKKLCAYKAASEKEAYLTESILAKKFLNTENSLNIDVFPIYYEMIEQALS